MLSKLAPIYYIPWISWILITIVQVMLLKASKGLLKFFRIPMVYLLTQSFCQLLIMIFSKSYRDSYYVMTILESLLLAYTSIEIGNHLLLSYKRLVTYVGPIAIAIPTFVTYITTSVKDIGQEQFIVKSIRISELTFIFSLALLFICIAFEEDKSNCKEIARGYAAFLTLLVICTEVQIRTGITDLVKILWPLSWFIGLSLVYITIHRCRHNWKLSTSTLEGIQNGYTR